MDYKKLASEYREELLSSVIPFWEKFSLDKVNGGFFTCLNRDGKVYDTGKFIWLQARQVYIFSKLYQEVERKQEWLDIALHGADFLERYGRNEHGHWYFSLEADGTPSVDAYNIFSDCFAALAFGTLARITTSPNHKKIAENTLTEILERRDNPKGRFSKQHPQARKLKNFALPMILCNLSQELHDFIEPKFRAELETSISSMLMNSFYNQESGVILENIGLNEEFVDSFEGRLVNPGHAIEAMWFVMDLAHKNGDLDLVKLALVRAIQMIEYGWDEKYGGLFYFMDVKGYPTQQLEWDQKLWWPHLEALVCLAKGIEYLRDPIATSWFHKIHEYTWNHFRDLSSGEWYGYLNRRGEVLLPLKGGKWKGCFHVPRALLYVWQSLERGAH